MFLSKENQTRRDPPLDLNQTCKERDGSEEKDISNKGNLNMQANIFAIQSVKIVRRTKNQNNKLAFLQRLNWRPNG